MAWQALDLLGEKTPMVLAGVLTALISTSYNHFSGQTHLYAAMEPHEADWTRITIENISISRAADYHLIDVLCAGKAQCLPPFQGRIDVVGWMDAEAPASKHLNQPCAATLAHFRVSVTLPVNGRVEVFVAAKPEEITLSIAGKSTNPPCGTVNLAAVDTQLLRDTSMGSTVKSSVLRNFSTLFNTILAAFVLAVSYFVYQTLRRKRRVARKK